MRVVVEQNEETVHIQAEQEQVMEGLSWLSMSYIYTIIAWSIWGALLAYLAGVLSWTISRVLARVGCLDEQYFISEHV